jgi:biotin carboxyl carrier protein
LTEYEITIGNKLEKVEINKDSASAKETYLSRIGSRETNVVVEKREPARIIVSIDERIYSVRQLKRSPGQVDFLLNGELVPARLKDKFSSDVKSDVASVGELVVSNFPAKVVKIERPGTKVKEGHVLIVLEAMKMEAQVKAPKNCEVIENFVREGEMVSRGGKLARLKFL